MGGRRPLDPLPLGLYDMLDVLCGRFFNRTDKSGRRPGGEVYVNVRDTSGCFVVQRDDAIYRRTRRIRKLDTHEKEGKGRWA
jgi:hypothetical protein